MHINICFYGRYYFQSVLHFMEGNRAVFQIVTKPGIKPAMNSRNIE